MRRRELIGAAALAALPGVLSATPLDKVKSRGTLVVAVYNDMPPFHVKGAGKGYLLTFGDKRIYVAGDTGSIPEMKRLEQIDVAFLPMNLPYTMTPEMTAAAAQSFLPKVLYPYHYGETDSVKLVALSQDTRGIEVRIRRMR